VLDKSAIGMNKYLGIFLIVLIGMSSCKDDDSTPDPKDETVTNTMLLTNGEWEMQEGTIVPSIDVEVVPGTIITVNNYWDLLSYIGGGTVQTCDKDNLMIMKLDSSVIMDEGPTKCDAMDPQITDGGKWNFQDNETRINFSSFPMDPTGEPRIMDIEELTTTKLNLNMTYLFEDPITGDTTNHDIVMKYLNVK
jgi:hypothetical protein